MKKNIGSLLVLVLLISVFAACSKKEDETPATDTTTTDTATTDATTTLDVVATASIVTDGDALVKALSPEGFWLAGALNDITLTEDLVVEGAFVNKEVPARKIALYTQDADRNILESFTLTAPKMIVRSENTKIQGGTFVGDVYVEANGFTVSNATVEGNVYYASQEYMDSAVIDETGVVTGEMKVQ